MSFFGYTCITYYKKTLGSPIKLVEVSEAAIKESEPLKHLEGGTLALLLHTLDVCNTITMNTHVCICAPVLLKFSFYTYHEYCNKFVNVASIHTLFTCGMNARF